MNNSAFTFQTLHPDTIMDALFENTESSFGSEVSDYGIIAHESQLKALSRLAALSPLLLLGVGQMANATDLLAGGKDDVKATFGADSFVMMCIIIAELIVGVAMYIRTKNLLILLGLVVVIVFTTVGLTFIN